MCGDESVERDELIIVRVTGDKQECFLFYVRSSKPHSFKTYRRQQKKAASSSSTGSM
jgi:hypothetical protein